MFFFKGRMLFRKRKHSLKTIFKRVPSIAEYGLLPKPLKDFVDDIITDSLKTNPVARVKGKNRKPKQVDFWQLSWNDMLELQEAVMQMHLETVFYLVYGLTENEFLQLPVFNAFACYKWIKEQLTEIAKTEADILGGEPTADEKNAGVEELSQFGYANNLDMIAGGDVLKYDDILMKPYAVIFRKLYMEQVKQEIQQKYLENVSRKTKRNS